MELERWSEIVRKLEEVAKPDEQGYSAPDGQGGQRHGSWVVDYLNATPDLNRYVRFSITEMVNQDYKQLLVIEAGAQSPDGTQNHSFPAFEEGYPDLEAVIYDIEPILAPKLSELMEGANTIKIEELKSVPFYGS